MDDKQSTALTVSLLVAGLVLFAVPVVAPAEVPENRVQFAVEGDWGDLQDQENLEYTNLTDAEQEIFDTARQQSSGYVNRTPGTAPPSLTPDPDSIDIYNVRYEGEYYLLEVRHLSREVDFLTQQLPRLGSLGAGISFVVFAAYRRYG